jgi:hypothetical protein
MIKHIQARLTLKENLHIAAQRTDTESIVTIFLHDAWKVLFY